ncbi:NADH-quinone oxidoreductase subunit B [Longivirga aurantiaca]|uniref:NADH-quinone oxidoreductase subunit B n=1 Tax=Longivirga aurantiaca TaxID=1837743 RepID=A0ABW1SXY9_9ACTN
MADGDVLLGLPGLGRPGPAAPLRLTVSLDGADDRVVALHVAGAGLACCSVELVAAALRRPEARAAGLGEADAVAPAVDVIVVSGTCTDILAPALAALHAALPVGTPVLSFGACASSGGPYWDSYSVTKGVDQVIPVDVYVPGCPPRPEALADGLRLLPGVAR